MQRFSEEPRTAEKQRQEKDIDLRVEELRPGAFLRSDTFMSHKGRGERTYIYKAIAG